MEVFREAVTASEAAMDLGRAALAVARIEHPGLDDGPSLAALDDLAARAGVAHVRGAAARLGRLRELLFQREGFRGNAADYYDPRNSCLNDVLVRRLGIPITLSVLLMEVGRRVGVALDGLGLPGHFIVAARLGDQQVLLDPFNGGKPVTPVAAAELAARAVGRPVRLGDEHWMPCTKRQIVIRMLRNLKSSYVKREDWVKTLAVVDRLLVVEPDSPVHRRDRGTVLVRLGRLHQGAAEWERYVTHHPDAHDAAAIRHRLRTVRERLGALN
jgi:regulator of sirC expression with transglutaminase-like and TPR domain